MSTYRLSFHPAPHTLSPISGFSSHQHDSCRFSARGLGSGLSSRTGFLIRGGHERSRVRVSAYREEDWIKLLKPEALKKEDLKEYLNEDSVWLWVFKSWNSGIKGALQFLLAQPGKIKFIEWPSAKSTVKMAVLTLVVVMFLIAFLYSVDSLFRHILKSSMRPMP